MQKKHIVIYITLITIALIVSISLYSQYLPYLGKSLQPTISPDILIIMKNVKVTGINGKEKTWQINADSVNLAQNRTLVTINNVHDGVVFIDKDKHLNLSSKKVVYDINSETLRAQEGFEISDPENFTIIGNSIVWTEFNKQLKSTEKLTYKDKWKKITANKFIADFNIQEYQMWEVDIKADPKEFEQFEWSIQ